MSDFIESARNFVSSAMSRTGWEAQKQMRTRSKQNEIDKLLEQRRQLLDELGLVAMNLYTQGTLTDSQLSRLCASVLELDHDVKSREEQLKEIKSEVYPADQFAPVPTTDYTPPSSKSSSPSPAPTSQADSSQPGAQPQTAICPNCGSTVRPNALYCRSCGAKLR